MGNCQEQFSNIPPQFQDEWENKERVDISMISRQHMTIKPHQHEQLKIGAIQSQYIGKQIDNQRLYDTKAIHTQKTILINQSKQDHTVRTIVPREIQILDYNFYRSLGLEEYSYHPLVGQEFQKLDINQNIDREGTKYIGQWKNGEPYGNGVLTSSTKKYIGQFLNGLKHFDGRQIEKREVYEGAFQYDRRKGTGKLYKEKQIEEGEFDDVLVNGMITYKNGDWYEGPIVNGEYQGKNCKFYDASSKVFYEGEFQKGKMTGYGVLTYPDGKIYKGQLHDGAKHGKGYFKWDESTTYEGLYHYDQKHGEGILQMKGKILQGNFKNGLLDGDVVVKEGPYKTIKKYLYGRQIMDDAHITEQGLPEHWRE